METIENNDFAGQMRLLRLLLGQRYKPLSADRLGALVRINPASIQAVEFGRRVLHNEDRDKIALHAGAIWNPVSREWRCSEKPETPFNREEHLSYVSQLDTDRWMVEPNFERFCATLEVLLAALSAREANLALLQIRKSLVTIAEENQIAPDIIRRLKAAVNFGGAPVEDFKLSDVQEDYQSPEARLTRKQAKRTPTPNQSGVRRKAGRVSEKSASPKKRPEKGRRSPAARAA